MMDNLNNIGEFGLIDRFQRFIKGGEGVIVGIGDDCAVLESGGRLILVSSDAFVEDVHFSRAYSSPKAVGHKAAMAALSDIAAMGGRPRFLLVTLAISSDTEIPWLDDLYRGLGEAAEACGATIVGGDTTANHGPLVIDVTVIGEPQGDRYLLRSGARPGDLVAVTGMPGRSAAGLFALQSGLQAPALIEAHLWPVARIREGQWLATHTGVRAMLDLSDGFLQDASHLAEASDCGLDIDPSAIRIHPDLEMELEGASLSPIELFLQSGEEYELVMALDPDEAPRICAAFEEQFGLPLQCVGRFNDASGKITVAGHPIQAQGYDHFASDV